LTTLPEDEGGGRKLGYTARLHRSNRWIILHSALKSSMRASNLRCFDLRPSLKTK
jgi:hypothetical protein